MTDADIDTQINELGRQRRELTDELAAASEFATRSRLAEQIEELGAQQRELEAKRRRMRLKPLPPAAPLRSPQPVRPTSNGATVMKPKFELYERVWGNSVHGEPAPAVSLTTTTITLNALAMKAIGVKVGDSLSLYFARNAGMIAFKKPPKGWSTNKSSKVSAVKASGAGALNSLATFLKWAGIKPKQAKGVYQLTYDEDHDHWWLQLPANAWNKPSTTSVSGGGSVARGAGKTSAAKRADLPATSPHRGAR